MGIAKGKHFVCAGNMAVSVLSRINRSGQIQVVAGGPSPAVTVDADGQLHTEPAMITHAGEGLDRVLWRWLS